MAEIIELIDLANLQNETTAVNAINANNETIENAFLDVLSLTGVVPNQMESTLDMNSNQIINLPTPSTANSPARLIDVVSNPTIVIPPVGTSGATVPLLNANNTFSGTETFTIEPVFPVPANSILGNNTGSSTNVINLTQAQTTAMLNPFTSSLQGVVPASGGGTTNFLRADGTWNSATASVNFLWSIGNLQATNDVSFPTVQMRLNADWMRLYNPSTTGTTFIAPGTVPTNLGCAVNAAGALNSDIHQTATVTISINSPAVVTWNAHGLHAGDLVYFTTTGTLPTGISPSFRYYVSATGLTTNTFQISGTRGGASVTTTGTQSGTHTANAGVYLALDNVWFYYIWGSGPGVSTLNSSWGPLDTNGAGVTGPYLPSGYTHYAPAFPLVYSANGVQSASGLSGASNLRIRGNHVYFPNVPFVQVIGYPSAPLDLSPWIPASYQTFDLYADLELTYAAGGGIGGCVLSTTEGNFWNASLYSAGTLPAAMDGCIPGVYSPNRQVTFTFLHSSGTPNNSFAGLGPVGYTFPQ